MLAEPRVKRLLSSEHFSVDGTLIDAWASMKSFKLQGTAGCRRDARWRDDGRQGAMRRSIFAARHAPTRHIAARPTRTPGCTARDRGMEAKLYFIGMG